MPTHYQGPPDEVRALDAFIKLMRAAGSLLARTGRPLAADGLTAGQFGVLETLLSHLGPLHQCDLARKHLQSGGNITMIVDNLEKAGLVRRERMPQDRRYVCVHLTRAGRGRIADAFSPGTPASIARHMNALTPAEQEELGRPLPQARAGRRGPRRRRGIGKPAPRLTHHTLPFRAGLQSSAGCGRRRGGLTRFKMITT